tara:strand:+ start:2304 stop:3410 length:1107 start_codon:yes stop_codon:yes gene_type:complete
MAQVGDYNIANASGASVRSDLNAVFAAIKTLNSGGTDPSNTEAFMPYVDTADNNNLKIRNSANNGFTTIGPVNSANLGLLPRTGGTMTGVLALPSQSAGNPSINFGDSTTGLFRKGSNQIGVAASGTEQLFLDQNGVTLNLQNEIRFGDANSSHYAAIKAPSTISSNFTLTLPVNDGNNGEFLKTDGSGNLSFASATTSLNNLNASNLTSGTVPNARFPSTLPAVSGANLTNLNATRLTSGTIPNARFPSTLPAVSGAALTGIDGRIKAFINLNGTGSISIRQSFNVSSITDNETGGYQVNFSNNMSSSNYIITHCISQNNAGHNSHGCLYIVNSSIGTSSFKSRTFKDTSSGETIDKVMVSFMVIQN